jgi:hypothetical protein
VCSILAACGSPSENEQVKTPALLFCGSFLVRTGIVLAGFYLVSGGRLDRLAVCFISFFATRQFIVKKWAQLPKERSKIPWTLAQIQSSLGMGLYQAECHHPVHLAGYALVDARLLAGYAQYPRRFHAQPRPKYARSRSWMAQWIRSAKSASRIPGPT